MNRAWFVSLLALVGCYTPVTHLDEVVNDRQKIEFRETNYNQHTTLGQFLQEVFTDEAYAAIKDIPIVTGPLAGTGLASGTSFWGKIISLVMFADFDRRVVLSENGLTEYGVEGVIHELIHQLDDMSRDGEASFINIDEFRVAYKLCESDTQYHGIIRSVEEKNPDGWITAFGVGDDAERIAFSGQFLWKQAATPDLEFTFRKIYRKFQEKYGK